VHPGRQRRTDRPAEHREQPARPTCQVAGNSRQLGSRELAGRGLTPGFPGSVGERRGEQRAEQPGGTTDLSGGEDDRPALRAWTAVELNGEPQHLEQVGE
jgi:hypothetical protein